MTLGFGYFQRNHSIILSIDQKNSIILSSNILLIKILNYAVVTNDQTNFEGKVLGKINWGFSNQMNLHWEARQYSIA